MIYYFITKLDDEIVTWGATKKFLHHGEYEQFHDFPIWTYKETTESGSKKFEAVFKVSSNKEKVWGLYDKFINLPIIFDSEEEMVAYRDKYGKDEFIELGDSKVKDVRFGLG